MREMNADRVIAYVGLGSNLGDRAGNLLLAVRGLLEAGVVIRRLSAIYETVAVGVPGEQPEYLNMVAECELHHVSPEQMMARMLRIEYLLGRKREYPKAPRTVDLDLLFFGNLQYHSDLLTVPHPMLHLRRFVLVPLNELAPMMIHPVLNQTIHDLLKKTPDKSEIRRWSPHPKNETGNEDPAAKTQFRQFI